ncbi:pyridoxal phosphate-dependent aminotransferase [Curvivirga sp.]|uniref:pyridoxal phosphate-dependent aminotransferase n=1 Tax=Curvivirga sp. TaxID=2856848 RepID=UPI003B5CE7A3
MQLAENLSRLGTESAFTVMAQAAEIEAAGHHMINLGIGQPDFPTPDHIVEAGIQALKNGAHGYTAANGIPELRQSVAHYLHRQYKTDVNLDNVLIVPGGKVTMWLAILIFGEKGGEILYPDPGFPIYASAINYTGASACPYPLLEENQFAFSADDLLSRITDKTRLIIINSPANPTGGVTPIEELDKLAEGLKAFPNVAIMSDEIYSRMLYNGQKHKSILEYEHLRDRAILLDGWSKTYAMTGWRMGFSVWPDKLIDHATRLCINSHSCINAAAQYAGLEALNGPQDAVDDMLHAFDERRIYIAKAINQIPKLSCITPAGAFYAFINIKKTGLSALEMQNRLLNEAHVVSIAGTSFGDYGEGYIRLSYANSLANIQEAIKRIDDFIRNL